MKTKILYTCEQCEQHFDYKTDLSIHKENTHKYELSRKNRELMTLNTELQTINVNLKNKLNTLKAEFEEKEEGFSQSTNKLVEKINYCNAAMEGADKTIYDMDKEISKLKQKLKSYESKQLAEPEKSKTSDSEPSNTEKSKIKYFKCEQCKLKVTSHKELNKHYINIHGRKSEQ